MGSRFGGLKQLAPVGPGGESLLEYSLYDAERAGFTHAVIVIRSTFEHEFRDELLPRVSSGLSVSYTLPDRTPVLDDAAGLENGLWGTAHALLTAGDNIDGPFAVVNADDFYGRSAFAAARDALRERRGRRGPYVLISYPLGSTLSPNGPVSRGICKLDGDRLKSVVEHTKLERGDGAAVSVGGAGNAGRFDLDTPVSMNFWGFTPDLLDKLVPLMEAFAESAAVRPGAELRLPDTIQYLLDSGRAAVDVIPAGEQWFGMTYEADLDDARRSILSLVDGGHYPRRLSAR